MKPEETQVTLERVRAIKEKFQDQLLSRENVIGLGIGLRTVGGQQTDEIALVVLVSHKVPTSALAVRDRLPSQIEGVPVDVQEIGEIGIQNRPLG